MSAPGGVPREPKLPKFFEDGAADAWIEAVTDPNVKQCLDRALMDAIELVAQAADSGDTSLETKTGAMLSAAMPLATYTAFRGLRLGRIYGQGLTKAWAIMLFGLYLKGSGMPPEAALGLAVQALGWVLVPSEPLRLSPDSPITVDDQGQATVPMTATPTHVIELVQFQKWWKRNERGRGKPGRPRKAPGSPKAPYKRKTSTATVELVKRLTAEGKRWPVIAHEAGYTGNCSAEPARRWVRRIQHL